MATYSRYSNNNRLRLYDINANKREDIDTGKDYMTATVPKSPVIRSPTMTVPRTPDHHGHNHATSMSSSGYGSTYGSGYGSGYGSVSSPSYLSSPNYLSSPPPQSPRSPSPIPSPLEPPVAVETRHDIEYTRAPDMFPCGHVLCHNCVRKFMRRRQRFGDSCCPVCHKRIDGDISLAAMGFPGGDTSTNSCSSGYNSGDEAPTSPGPGSTHGAVPEPSDPTPVSLLNNFDEIVSRFNGINGHTLRRLKDESVTSKSMGMTFTNTQCHLCMENHGTLRVVQEYNKLAIRHERPHAWSNYFYRLQQGKVVTEFYSQVNSSCICVPCTYKELQQQKLPDLALPNINPQQNTQVCLAEVGKIVARNSAPIMALQGKNVIEIDHTIRLRERADHFNFHETAAQIERMVKQHEDTMLRMASKQIRDTGRLYHVKESNEVEYDMDETDV